MTRRIAPLLLAAAAACAGSSSAEPAKPTPVSSEREEIEAARPASPLRTERVAGLRAAERCGRGRCRLTAEALSARFGERLLVYARGPRSVSGRYRLSTIAPAGKPSLSEGSFGQAIALDASFIAEGDGVPLEPGTRFAIDIWSDAPNDLAGVVFVIEQQAVRRDMTPARWAVHRKAERAWTERYLAYIGREVAAHRAQAGDQSPQSSPSQPSQPRPGGQ